MRWWVRGPLIGMVCVLAATFLFATMNAIIRGLSGAVPPVEIAFFRSAFGLLLLLPLVWWFGPSSIRTARFPLHATRGVIHAVSMMIFFVALSMVPLAETTALEFAAPIMSTVIAILFLGEVVHVRRLIALAVGIAGVFVVVRPGFETVSLGQILILVSVVMWAGCQLMIRELSKTDTAFAQGFYMVAFFTPMTLIVSLPGWVWPSLPHLAALAGLAVIATAGTWLYGEAFRRADMSAILPLESTKLIWSVSYGLIFFAEQPEILT
ncbi:MAG: DMT family transporter, partial [Alphaproteobacteria bacterium]|nr:DMT family transporter [Alphaproteobacteria bacterium]